MPKKIFKLPVNLERDRLCNFYRPQLDKMVNVSLELKKNFYDFVIPSLAEPRIVKELSDLPRYFCLFQNCKSDGKSFASKQKYIQHLTIIHDQELPLGGSFISPNDKSTKPGGFWCSKCGHHYCRRDHLQHHFKSSVHCRDASILITNPLIQKEIEYESKLAIEYKTEPFPKSDKFEFKSLLAIEWKPVENKSIKRLTGEEEEESKKKILKIESKEMIENISKAESRMSDDDDDKELVNALLDYEKSFN
ncbi:unnamed protein product [Brachionus calyciflorus]|uniref:C2H2-type domain-containing protein n=1 Tax=Brachionus calyciflorus TaxID=104777 RepID=A0A814H1Z5_9BILA|nr:unnamed protein product [Brachionus calyciflorus]